MYQSIEMFENLPQSDSEQTELELTLSSADSRARTLVVQVSELVSMIQTGKLPAPVCGVSMPESLAKLSQNGSWLKMFGDSCQSLLWEAQGEDSELFSGTWPTWGIVPDGVAMALPMLERRTNDKESLLWPTAMAADGAQGAIFGADDTYVKKPSGVYRKLTRNGTDGSCGLARIVEIQNWPTPQASCDANTACYNSYRDVDRFLLRGAVANQEGQILNGAEAKAKGQLNADWVEILMNYPIGFTDIDKEMMDDATCERSSRKILQIMRGEIGTEEVQREVGRLRCVFAERLLQSAMCRESSQESEPDEVCDSKEYCSFARHLLRKMQDNGTTREPSPGREHKEQFTEELDNALRFLPYEASLGNGQAYCSQGLIWPGWPAGLGEKLWRTAEAGDHCDRQFARNSRGEPKLSAQAQIMPHGQYSYEPPRIVAKTPKGIHHMHGHFDVFRNVNRAKRLKCLGNSVLPQQAYPIFKAIMEVEDALQNQTARP